MTDFARAIDRDGYVIVPGVLEAPLIERLKGELEGAIAKEVEWHGGTSYPDYGMVLLCSLYGRALVEVCGDERLMAPFEAVLGEGCILYAYTSSSMPPSAVNYSGRVHVDCPRIIPGYVTNLGATILLDDFTEENGATWFLPGSHRREIAPTQQEFFSSAKRVLAPAGSVFFFNARIWHAGGKNATPRWRHALTMNMCRPYMKQRLDVPRMMAGMDLSYAPPKALQKLGFLAQVPASYDEYYAPLESRKFRQKAE